MSLSSSFSTPRNPNCLLSGVTPRRADLIVADDDRFFCSPYHAAAISPDSSNNSTASLNDCTQRVKEALNRKQCTAALSVNSCRSAAQGAQGRTNDLPADGRSDRSAKQSAACPNNRSVDGSSSSRSTGLARSSSTRTSGNEASKEMRAPQPTQSESSVTNNSMQLPTIAVENEPFVESSFRATGWDSRPGYSRHRQPHFNEFRSRIQYLKVSGLSVLSGKQLV
eukprot:GHVS01090759.1.p1 GENE.GHVS01090759.1~~GHVS01090759.1.p1  ORF type:complete len:224 (+),score=30.47 GHVS01090759.1:231-902(+)